MPVSVPEFWNLLVQSQLFSSNQQQRLEQDYSRESGAGSDSAAALEAAASAKKVAEWLVRRNMLSRYQAVVLLSGRAGPFQYGDYRVYDRVEQGQLTGYFRAVHVPTNHPVMLRFLTGAATLSADLWGRAQTWLTVPWSPHVVRYYEAVDLGSFKFLVLENLRGQSLAEFLTRQPRVPPDVAARWGRELALALHEVHQSNRAHGAVRAENCWIDSGGLIRLLVDFSAAEPPLIGSDQGLTTSRDPRSDVRSLGVILYRLITGQSPDSAEANPQSPPWAAYGCPTMLGDLIHHLQSARLVNTLPSAAVLAEQLKPFVGDLAESKVAEPPASRKSFEARWPQRVPTAGPQPSLEVTPLEKATAATESRRDIERIAPPSVRPVSLSPPMSAANSTVEPVRTATSADNLALPSLRAGETGDLSVAASDVAIRTEPSVAELRRSGETTPTTSPRRGKAKQQPQLLVWGASLLAFAAVVGALAWFLREPSGETTPPDGGRGKGAPTSVASIPAPSSTLRSPNGAAASPGRSPTPGGEVASAGAAPDDGKSLWASPTSGPPLSLQYLPSGPQLVFSCRPAELLKLPEGQRLLQALGPRFAELRGTWEQLAGLPLDAVSQLTMAFYGDTGTTPRVCTVVRANRPLPPPSERWPGTTPVEGLPNVLGKNDWAYYIPADAPQTFVVGKLDPEIREVINQGTKAPLLRRELGQLLSTSDSLRHATIMFTPQFLFGDGQDLFAGDYAKGRKPLQDFLGDQVKAGSLSFHLGEDFFVEARLAPDLQVNPGQFARQFGQLTAEVPERLESYLANLDPHPYWKLIAIRYPAMVRYARDQLRVAVEGSQVVSNLALPLPAAHNLTFSTEMLLSSAPGNRSGVVTGSPAATPPAPRTIDELLQAKLSISFAQDSLEFAMQNVATEVKSSYPNLPFEFQIRILGNDLESESITRNQQIRDFQQSQKTVSEVLTALVMKANPVTTVKSPREVDQKLVWVVGPDPEAPAKTVVLITTRVAAASRQWPLPEPLRPQ